MKISCMFIDVLKLLFGLTNNDLWLKLSVISTNRLQARSTPVGLTIQIFICLRF